MGDAVRVGIIGSGPAGLAAACRAAELGIPHLLLEAEAHLAHTIFRYQKGKHVMAEPGVLPLRASIPFEAGKREAILEAWNARVAQLGVNVRYRANVTAIHGSKGNFTIVIADGSTVRAEYVVLAIGVQGNIRKLGCEGEDLEFVQYQLDDPDAYQNETIVVVGAGDAAIENAVALAARNKVTIVNRRDEFDRAKDGNNALILKAIEDGKLACVYNATVASVRPTPGAAKPGAVILNTAQGEAVIPVDRVIARLGATPPREFVERCGVMFPGKDPGAVPAVSPQYESNVPGLYIIGALAGFPLIKQAMNQGYEVVEFIEGRRPEPADAPLLKAKFARIPGFRSIDATLERIRARIPILSPLTPLQLREFLLDSEIRTPQPGEIIFRRNDYSNSFFSILDGSVEIAIDPVDDTRTLTLGSGQFFGEMSLISGRRRSATVRAGAGCVLIETPRRSMNKLIASVPSVKRVLDETFLLRAIQAHIAPGIDADALKDVVASATVRRFKAGETVFREGDAPGGLHLIRKGSVTVSRIIGGREVVLAYVPAGQYVGEMALLSDTPRTATVRAAVATETIELEGGAFKALLATRPELRARLEETYRQRVMANVNATAAAGSGSLVQFLMAQGLGEATDVLLIDESLCVRCDHCEKACADTHGGISRLDREAGPTVHNLHVPTSCRHCEHPHCMKDCPPDAIHRSPSGEVFISDACIGCGNCVRNCPYGVIQMGAPQPHRPSLWRWLLFGGEEPGAHTPVHDPSAPKKAVKCDMCKDLPGGPACVRACPTGAALRVSPERFIRIIQGSA
ncbi:Thioredoxin reductase [Fontimonas thermophila]|uniref:Thioredoxin reductase n=1 Tax=Fontimonas thermophila TaxID=1076937 RepID=A0A1I2I832_9GAMM|nr:cyclic nucleotide-binding domain-containing protein [Fontimonas thermophila]SFF37267.1 Thioredoxin reductase [Fontimonas thermophila]